jgi:predicted RNA-binding protein associated with RNAse of E/G family
MFPGRAHSVWLTWRPDGEFVGFYVNLEEPFRRTPIGFDTNDHTLDIVVTPDLQWSWKDELLLEEQASRGEYSAGLVEAIRGEAALVIATIESRGSPFTDGWEDWRPDSTWPTPRLADTWNTEPAALWERRAWAYPHSADPTRSESS